jgi:hypothetical protein
VRARKLTLLVPLTIALGLLLAAPGSARTLGDGGGGGDDETALPSRVANAIKRAELSLDEASQSIAGGETPKAVALLNSFRLSLVDADKAARRQMKAAPADEDAETTPGPDSVIAVLTLEQTSITTISDLFNRRTGVLVNSLASKLVAALNDRDKLLTSVIKLNPEGAGADYADGMADSVESYDDEVANITEALADDQLSPVGRSALTAALTQSKAARSKVTKAFGGGE